MIPLELRGRQVDLYLIFLCANIIHNQYDTSL